MGLGVIPVPFSYNTNMSNIIDSIQVSGVTYDLVGSGSITSGEVQTMIDESVSGKVNTVDNQVPAVIKTDCTRKNVPVVSQRYCTITLPDEGTYTYDDKINLVRVTWYTEDDIRFKAKVNSGTIIQVINSANTVVETVEPLNIDATSVTGNYFTTEAIDSPGDKGVKYECNEGYAFKSLNLELERNQYNLYNCWVTACSNETIVPSYQSRYAIENYIYPKLDEIESSITQATSGKVDTSTYTAYTAATDTALAGKQTTLTAGTGIDITDNVISATGGGGGNPTVEVTQAQYDALVTAGTVSADTYYIITDAEAGDLTNYYTKSETNTLLNGKQATLVSGTNIKTINNESLLGSGNIDIQGGGGKAVSGGTNISVTTGTTADTINCTLNAKNGTGANSIIFGNTNNISSEQFSVAFGSGTQAKGIASIAEGESTQTTAWYCHSSGKQTLASGNYSNAEGDHTTASTESSHSEGIYTLVSNKGEHSQGWYNVSTKASDTFGDSGNTLFSVGNGTSTAARHNAFEIRQNGDIYITSGGTDIKLQDNLGGGGGVNVVQTTGTSTTDVMSQNAVTTQLSGYVTTDTDQNITGRKTFINSEKAIEFKQISDTSKAGFKVKNSAATNNEVASFEFRPNTFTIDNVQHPLMYFGHYRNTNTANAGVPQTVIGFRQYDQKNAAAYHYLLPLPEKAKTPFSLTTSFNDYYAPMGFKNGSTMITADNTGVVDLSSELGGLKLKKLTQAEYDALSPNYDSNTLYVIVN